MLYYSYSYFLFLSLFCAEGVAIASYFMCFNCLQNYKISVSLNWLLNKVLHLFGTIIRVCGFPEPLQHEIVLISWLSKGTVRMEPVENFLLDSYETGDQNLFDERNIPLTLSSYLGKTVQASNIYVQQIWYTC